jgi:hypothetical protein
LSVYLELDARNLMEKDINRAKYLYLDKIVEENDLELHIYIDEAVSDSEIIENIESVSRCSPIITNELCERYNFIFQNYVCYSIRNESFTSKDDEEEFQGNLFRLYSKSKFLDYVQLSCIGLEVLAPKMKHYEIICLNHIIDVATENEPIVT